MPGINITCSDEAAERIAAALEALAAALEKLSE